MPMEVVVVAAVVGETQCLKQMGNETMGEL